MFFIGRLYRLSVCTGICICLSIVRHILPAANIRAIFLCFLCFVIRGLYKQFSYRITLEPTIVLFALISGINNNLANIIAFIILLQLLHKGNQGLYIAPVSRDISIERRPLERNTSESEATEQLQNLYKLEIILNDQENFCKHIDFFSCLFYPFSELGERMLRL